MFSILLAIIYIAFISLGLPDSLLGAGWPTMHETLGVPSSYAGIISMIISGGTIVSSLMSDRLTRRMGAGLVTAVSVLLTALALIGFSLSNSFIALCILAIPYGLGAGAVDAALNNYVALHYSSRQMSWLHCMWGVGAAISPYIMSSCLTRNLGWQSGYRTVGLVQLVLTAMLFLTLRLWQKRPAQTETSEVAHSDAKPLGLIGALKVKGVPLILMAFFGYCAMEATAILWASSYLAAQRGVDAITAAKFSSLFLMGITLGRFLTGFIADRMGDTRMVLYGGLMAAAGIIMIMLPLGGNGLALGGLMVMGVGCAPIYPAIIHSTPANFGADKSQAIVGIQMASAYVGSTFMPPLFGAISSRAMWAFPAYMLFFAAIMLGAYALMLCVLKNK